MAPAWDFARGPSGVAILHDVGLEHGLSSEQLLQGAGLTALQLKDPATIVQGAQEMQVARNLLARLGANPGLGAEVGRRHRLPTMGVWGFVVLTSASVGDAIQVGLRYVHLSSAFLRPEVRPEADVLRILLHEDEIPEDVRGFLVERELTAISTIIEAILGEMRELGDHAFALHVDGPRRELVIANAVLARPMPQADPSIRRAVEAECERLLEARQRRSGAAARVRARLLEQPDAMPSMADLASELHLDVRTLRRHLAADGTTFRALRQEVCTVLAVELLETVGLGVGEVAARLGYSDATAFTHAFTRWKGKPPSALS